LNGNNIALGAIHDAFDHSGLKLVGMYIGVTCGILHGHSGYDEGKSRL
tara:strand:- start:550 stop:693 length:144 start_codon:yes stop_codon:yes gene_type:complete